MRIHVEVDGARTTVEGDDVLLWRGVRPDDAAEAKRVATEHAAGYVDAHPRPAPDAQGSANVPARQRMALIRRLAAGPASRAELLETMRAEVGYVGGDDWRNRMDELRGHGKRGGGHAPLPLEHRDADDTYRLTRTFATLTDAERDDLARAKGVLDAVGGLAERGRVLLDALLPDVQPSPTAGSPVHYPSADVLRAFDAAMRRRRAVRVTYRPQGRPLTTYDAIVPRAYLPGDTAVRAYVVKLRPDGRRDAGRQLALDRLVSVEPLDAPTPAEDVFVDPSTDLVLWVTPALARVLERRPVFDLHIESSEQLATESDPIVEVRGRFNPELNWEVLRVLLTWAGSVRVIEPPWLAVGFATRLVEGLVMQASDPSDQPPPSYPNPGDAGAEARAAHLDDHLGVLLALSEALRPPPEPATEGKARRVAPPDWWLDG